jgi:hypothetical protein
MELVYKGYSRCFVFREEDKEVVYNTIKEIDESESQYIPTDWVTVWDGKGYSSSLNYNGKFDIDLPKLIDECGKKGVGIIVRSTTITDDCF